mmetsp:Transcript_25841/g.64549  ORF Transcript_25841/g.64549 Transcript_25841/m.64549 type:complete len:298 (+) Transcript_25841:199-1092(+)
MEWNGSPRAPQGGRNVCLPFSRERARCPSRRTPARRLHINLLGSKQPLARHSFHLRPPFSNPPSPSPNPTRTQMKGHGGSGDILEDVSKATEIVKMWTDPTTSPAAVVPKEVLKHCKGLVFVHFVKIGALISGSVGSGFVIAKINKGTPEEYWSGPSALSSGAFGVGAQVGGEMVHNVFVLNTAEAVEAYYKQAKLKIGTDITCTVLEGDFRLEKSTDINTLISAPMCAYSYSRGAIIGVSVEGTVLGANQEANYAFYGKTMSTKDILTDEREKKLDAKYLALAELYGQLDVYNKHA